MRLLSGNPGMYQHSVEHSTEGETTQHEPEHGEDTIARVKGAHRILDCIYSWNKIYKYILTKMICSYCSWTVSVCFVLLRPGEGSSEEIPVNSRRGRWRQSGSASGPAAGVRGAWGGAEDRQHIPAAPPGGGREGQRATQKHQTEALKVVAQWPLTHYIKENQGLLTY